MNSMKAFLEIGMVALSAASALSAYSADPPTAATYANPTTPVVLPGKGPAQHPFLYAGEWDTRKPLGTVHLHCS